MRVSAVHVHELDINLSNVASVCGSFASDFVRQLCWYLSLVLKPFHPL